MFEIDYIKNFIKDFKSSPKQLNQPFESDAEIIKIGNKVIGITMDDFSSDDFFCDKDLKRLGRNLAIATISDLLVTGCTPEFYLHSIITPTENYDFPKLISEGVKEVLETYNTFLIGGDLGTANNWRYSGVAIGSYDDRKPITRILQKKRQNIWVTSTLGGINLNAYTGKFINDLKTKKDESECLRKYANAAIDTSGGLMESIWTLLYLNHNFTFYIDNSSIPYDKSVVDFCTQKQLPKEAFLLGGAGEYEFVFLTDIDVNIDSDNVTKIGYVEPNESSKVFWGNKLIKNSPPNPRQFASKEQYLFTLREYIKINLLD